MGRKISRNEKSITAVKTTELLQGAKQKGKRGHKCRVELKHRGYNG